MIKVIIERHVAEGLDQPYQETIKSLLRCLSEFPGYIAGEAYRDLLHPNHFYVIANWKDMDSWEHWFHSAERYRILGILRPFLEQPEKCTVLASNADYRNSEPRRPFLDYSY